MCIRDRDKASGEKTAKKTKKSKNKENVKDSRRSSAAVGPVKIKVKDIECQT